MNLCQAREPGETPALSRQPNDIDVALGRELIEIPHALANDDRAVRHHHFGDVIRQIEQLRARNCAAAPCRQQAPADQGHIRDTDHCAGQTDRREIEHTETLAQRVIAILSHNNIGRRANHRNHAAKN